MVHQLPKDKSLKDAPLPPLPFAHHIQEKKVGKTKISEPMDFSTLSYAEISSLIKEAYEMCESFQKRLEAIYEKTGWSSDYLKSYLSDSSNFNPAQWKMLNREREALRHAMFGDASLEKKGQTSGTAKKGHRKLATRRRNWMPMQ